MILCAKAEFNVIEKKRHSPKWNDNAIYEQLRWEQKRATSIDVRLVWHRFELNCIDALVTLFISPKGFTARKKATQLKILVKSFKCPD